MNARILRKWSIHTKNLMSCSASSLVVVVLLLLLLVTCAPSLVLATMNNQFPRTSSSLLSPSDALAPIPPPVTVENPIYMPKNVQVVVMGASAPPTQTRPRPASATTPPPTATATSSSSQQQPAISLAAATPLLPYRSHSSKLASPRVEVATNGDIMARESFPGFFTNQRNRPDDIQPAPASWPLPLRHQLVPHHLVAMTSSRSGGQKTQNQDILTNTASASASSSSSSTSSSRQMGWPQRLITSTHPLDSYNDDNEDTGDDEGDDINTEDDVEEDLEDTDDDEDDDEDDTQSDDKKSNARSTANSHDKVELSEIESKPRISVRNVVDTAATTSMTRSNSYQTQQQFSAKGQIYHPRRLVDRRHQVAPLTIPYRQQQYHDSLPALSNPPEGMPPTQQKTSTTTTLYSYKQTESGRNGFPETNHKSKTSEIDKVFDISNILNVNKIKSSAVASPIRFVIESYEVADSQPLNSDRKTSTSTSTSSKAKPEQSKNLLKQLRSRHHQQQQTARSRRDSLRSNYSKRYQHQVGESISPSISTSAHNQSFRRFNSNAAALTLQPHQHNNNHHNHHHNNNNLRQQRMRNKHARRYCSARDPAQLAFEAPTVFEGKIVSMTPDRRMNFSATVEVREVFKQQIGYRLQKYLRLQFAYRNSSGECDIYREQLRPRGLVKGDTIEPGRMYLLFVQQIDIGNFTILGQPIRKTKRVVEAVRNAVSENYGECKNVYYLYYLFSNYNIYLTLLLIIFKDACGSHSADCGFTGVNVHIVLTHLS